MIVLLGLREDPPLAEVLSVLEHEAIPHLFVDQRQRERYTIELSAGAELRGRLTVDDASYDLAALSALYLRPYDVDERPAAERRGARRPWAVEDALALWADTCNALVINRPAAMASNHSKPYQMKLIEAAGFAVPRTVITTEPACALELLEREGRVIYKSISGVRSIVSQLTAERAKDLADLAACPTQFQAYVPGDDHRVHVVGERVFACRLASHGDDYRYSHDTALYSVELPRALAERCVRLTRALGLEVSGIDLRRTPEDEWVCFEVNPSPGFSYFDQGGRAGIADAIAELLVEGSNTTP